MIYIKKYKKFIVLFMLIAAITVFTIILMNKIYGEYGYEAIGIGDCDILAPVYLNKGEKYDIGGNIKSAHGSIDKDLLKKLDGNFTLTVKNENVLSLSGSMVKAKNCGVTYIYYSYSCNLSENSSAEYSLFKLPVVVTGDESDYVEVRSKGDLTEENNIFILKNDITISEPQAADYLVFEFNGVLLNPDGYTITIEASSGLKALIRYNTGIIDGIDIDCSILSDEGVNSAFGLVQLNGSIIKNCTFNADIETTRAVFLAQGFQNCTINCRYNILDGEETGFKVYNTINTYDNVINFTFSGYLEGVEADLPELEENNQYHYILETGGAED